MTREEMLVHIAHGHRGGARHRSWPKGDFVYAAGPREYATLDLAVAHDLKATDEAFRLLQERQGTLLPIHIPPEVFRYHSGHMSLEVVQIVHLPLRGWQACRPGKGW